MQLIDQIACGEHGSPGITLAFVSWVNKLQLHLCGRECHAIQFKITYLLNFSVADGYVSIIVFWMFTCQMRTVQTPFAGILSALTSPLLMAKPPTAADRLPQLPLQSTNALSMET